MDLGLTGKVALIGGSSRGLGRAVADELANEGCSVVLCSRDAVAVQRSADEIAERTGVATLAVGTNLSEEAGVEHVISAAFARFDRVDVLVTNTGGPPAGPFESH